jgi:hypothetical protein
MSQTLLQAMRARGVKLRAVGERLRVEAPPGVLADTDWDALRAAKTALLAALHAEAAIDKAHDKLLGGAGPNPSDIMVPLATDPVAAPHSYPPCPRCQRPTNADGACWACHGRWCQHPTCAGWLSSAYLVECPACRAAAVAAWARERAAREDAHCGSVRLPRPATPAEVKRFAESAAAAAGPPATAGGDTQRACPDRAMRGVQTAIPGHWRRCRPCTLARLPRCRLCGERPVGAGGQWCRECQLANLADRESG